MVLYYHVGLQAGHRLAKCCGERSM